MPDLDGVTGAAEKAREWTQRRDWRIREAVADGASLRAVGVAAGLSHTAVAKIVAKGLV